MFLKTTASNHEYYDPRHSAGALILVEYDGSYTRQYDPSTRLVGVIST